MIKICYDGVNFPSQEFFVSRIGFINDSDGVIIVNFLKSHVLLLHFSINRGDCFCASFDCEVEILFFQLFRNFFGEFLNIFFPTFFRSFQFAENLVVNIGIVIF
ncbi:hypothetical protein D3C86_1493350 [compost metagenome]